MSETALRITVTGRVQGVGYRVWLRAACHDAGVTGWVRNRGDGAVEALLAGEAQVVRDLAERCRIGPPGAMVLAVDVRPSPGLQPVGLRILNDV